MMVVTPYEKPARIIVAWRAASATEKLDNVVIFAEVAHGARNMRNRPLILPLFSN